MDNIFVYMSPNLDALGAGKTGGTAQYYFVINTEGGEQLSALNEKLDERKIDSVNIAAIYEKENAEAIGEAVKNLGVFLAAVVLMYLIYYFIEKSGSIKNSKEYGIYRAIGVNKGNLLFKEAVSACVNNLISYFLWFLITAILMCVRYAYMNIAFGTFALLALGVFAVSAALMVGISLIPYLFVLYQTPAQILSKYDI